LSAFVVMSSVAARFYPPTVSGIAPPAPPGVFRIDHDEHYGQTFHLQYQPFKRSPWLRFNWRYDSGLVSGAVPCEAQTATCSVSTSAADPGGAGLANVPAGDIALVNNVNGLPLTADQEFEAGLTCNGVAATPRQRRPFACPASGLTSALVKIPSPNTENDDHNPPRIQPRSLFDLAVGNDNIFHTDHYKWNLRFTVINLANKDAVYNFFSTFSGTLYVSRAQQPWSSGSASNITRSSGRAPARTGLLPAAASIDLQCHQLPQASNVFRAFGSAPLKAEAQLVWTAFLR